MTTRARSHASNGDDLDALALYCAEVGRYPQLDDITSAALAEKAQAGSRMARTDLVNAHLRLVVHIARVKLRTSGARLPLLDLIQEGNLGLMRCVDAYDGAQGPFRTFAGQSIRWALATALARAQRDGEATSDALLAETVADEAQGPEEDALAAASDEYTLGQLRVLLTERERYVVQRLAGLLVLPEERAQAAKVQRVTLTMIGRELHVTRARAGQLKKAAAAKLAPYLGLLAPQSGAPVLTSLATAVGFLPTAGKTTTAATRSPAKVASAAAPQPNRTQQPSRVKKRRAARGEPLCVSDAPDASTGKRARSTPKDKKTA